MKLGTSRTRAASRSDHFEARMVGIPHADARDLTLPFPVLHPLVVDHVAGLLALTPHEVDAVRFGGAFLLEHALPLPRAGYAAGGERMPGARARPLFGSTAILSALRARGLDTTALELRSLYVLSFEVSWYGLRHLYADVTDSVVRLRGPGAELDSRQRRVELELAIEALFVHGRAGTFVASLEDPSEARTQRAGAEGTVADSSGEPWTSLSAALAHFEPHLDVTRHLVNAEPIVPSSLAFRAVMHPIVRALNVRVAEGSSRSAR